jgi:hypothetical protein
VTAKISRLAIASLILATAFYIPVIAGVAAILVGIAALRKIKASKEVVLGVGIARFSIGFGALHALLWILFLFPGASFEVPIGQFGVVFRDSEPVRVAGYGSHRKWPMFESVELYPDGELQKFEVEPEEVLLSTSKIVRVEVSGLWTICDPIKFAEYFHRPYRAEFAREIVEQHAQAHNLVMEGESIKAAANRDLAVYGVCITSASAGPAI